MPIYPSNLDRRISPPQISVVGSPIDTMKQKLLTLQLNKSCQFTIEVQGTLNFYHADIVWYNM